MGARLRETLLRLTVSLASCVCVAQTPEQALPDAPAPAGTVQTLTQAGKKASTVRPHFPGGMTTKQKYGLTYRRIVSVQTPLKALLVSGWEVGTGTGPDIATNGWEPFGKRVGYNAASISTTIFFTTGVVPALAHQDPRYFPLGQGPVKDRIKWAVRSEFVGVDDDGDEMPNYANLIGLALASVAVDAFTPHDSVSVGDTAESYVIKLGVGTGLNVVREFNIFERVKAIAHHSKSAEN